ncbi:MAG: Rv3235 family protein [Streptosporangiaceae bacterium]
MADTTARGVAASGRPAARGPRQAPVRSIPVPDVAPPYDDARQPRRGRAPRHGAETPIQSQRLAPAVPGGQVADPWPGRFAQALAETLAGTRPARQIEPWTSQRARERISRLGPMLATGDRPRIRRLIASSPAGGVLEMTVVIGLGGRVLALAVRLERTDVQPRCGTGSQGRGPRPRTGPWRCTAVESV